MKHTIKQIWHWYWRERRGVFLFPSLCGWRRVAIDVPVALLGLCAWYLYLSSLQAEARRFLLSSFGNPLCVLGILCVAAYQIGILYLRDQLPRPSRFASRLELLIPGRVRALYEKQHGRDSAVKTIGRIGLSGFISGCIGMLVANWDRIRP